MGVNQIREVKTTFVCDFCKHNEIVIADTYHDGLPKGWSVLAIVPSDQRPQTGMMPKNEYFPSSDHTRHCLSSDRQINTAIACAACSVYGLQAIKNAKPEESEQPPYKLKAKVFYLMIGLAIFFGAIAGFAANYFLRR